MELTQNETFSPILTKIQETTYKLMPYIKCALWFTFGAMTTYAVYDSVKEHELKTKLEYMTNKIIEYDEQKKLVEGRIKRLEKITFDADD